MKIKKSFISTKDLAKILGIQPQSLYLYKSMKRKNYTLTPIKRGKKTIYELSDCIRYVAEQKNVNLEIAEQIVNSHSPALIRFYTEESSEM